MLKYIFGLIFMGGHEFFLWYVYTYMQSEDGWGWAVMIFELPVSAIFYVPLSWMGFDFFWVAAIAGGIVFFYIGMGVGVLVNDLINAIRNHSANRGKPDI